MKSKNQRQINHFFSSNLNEYYKEMGKKAINHTKRMMPYWASNQEGDIYENSPGFNRQYQGNKITRRLSDKTPPSDQDKFEKKFRETYPELKEIIEAASKTAKMYEAGNCFLQTCVAFEYLKQQGVAPIEIFNMEGGNHAFLVIGRSEKTNPRIPNTWNSEAIVCDVWASEVYPADQFNYGFDTDKPVKNRKFALQTKGFPNLMYRQEKDKAINNFSLNRFSVEAQSYSLIKVISQFEITHKIPFKLQRYLEHKKDQLVDLDCNFQGNNIQLLNSFINEIVNTIKYNYPNLDINDFSNQLICSVHDFAQKIQYNDQLIEIIDELLEEDNIYAEELTQLKESFIQMKENGQENLFEIKKEIDRILSTIREEKLEKFKETISEILSIVKRDDPTLNENTPSLS